MFTTWHNKELPAVLEALRTNEGGLGANEAIRRLKEDGFNALPEAKPDGLAAIFLRQFRSPLIYILLAASGIVFLMHEYIDGSIILAVLLFNAIVGTIQEGKAQNTLLALKKFVETTATVLRGGQELTIPDREVVRGDVLVLQEGEKIPADARVIATNNLKVDEASLTGESEPVSKIPEVIHKDTLTAPEQRNMLFKGTNIVAGNGRDVVVATGQNTVIGKIAVQISAIDSEIPLKANIRYLSRAIIIVVAVISAFLFVLGLAKGQDIVTIFTTVVSLAVSIIPEGLPIVITLVLATGVWRMSKRNALIKKLQAVEALGQARVIAVDKTGTITKNELVVRQVWTGDKMFEVSGLGYEPAGNIKFENNIINVANHPELLMVGKTVALCASARLSFSDVEKHWYISGDPTEAAMVVFAKKIGFNKEDLLVEMPVLSEMPFDYNLKYHAVMNLVSGKNLLVAIGAPESIIGLSKNIMGVGNTRALLKEEKKKLEKILTHMSEQGQRVVAIGINENAEQDVNLESISELIFVGFLGMKDVLRPEVKDAMIRAEGAGVRIVMITGDHKITALAIAREANIYHDGDELLTGNEIDALTDYELSDKLSQTTVFTRVTPNHKLKIINAFKKRGEIIAMTGDGVNDEPSLVAADLGVAMGNIGTEVAKKADDNMLLDENI